MMKKAMKLFGVLFFAGLILTTSLWARQIVTVEDREWAKETIAREKDLAAAVTPNTIAVLNFNNLTDLKDLNPVEKGMAIMLISDLAQLEGFQIVERARMQALMDELSFAGKGFAGPADTARMGKMLGAEHVVGGDITMLVRDKFKLKSGLLEVPTEKVTGNPQAEGKLLAELFKMEKELLFEIIKQLEINLTSEEEEKLKKNLTDNLQAFLYLVEGIEYSDKGNNQKALESFENAGSLDPRLTVVEALVTEINVIDIALEKAEVYSTPGGGTKVLPSKPATTGFNSTVDDNVAAPDLDQVVDRDKDGYTDNLDCDDNNPAINPGSTDNNCDGLDNDCSGLADDGYVSMSTDCGVGPCAAVGFTSCVNGTVVDSCTPGAPSADNNCNGIDDNCNGVPDDDYVSMSTDCGIGACAAEGSTSCVNGAVVDSCVAGNPSADTNCNGIDENCNGVPDDRYVSTTTECGTGACYAEGSTSCVNGVLFDSCEPGAPSPDENCNGIDENCNGIPDEEYVSLATECGTGVCYAEGSTSCVNGTVYISCVEGTPTGTDSNCNGIDENCDGVNDDGYEGQVFICGVGACENSTQGICERGIILVPGCVPLPVASAEVCGDGIDNDCDEAVDENCSLVPPLASIESINKAHENIFNDATLETSVFSGDYFPRTFQATFAGSQPLTNVFGYQWASEATIYSILGREFNQLGAWLTVTPILEDDPGIPGVDDLFAHNLGLQTLGESDGPEVVLPAAVLTQINSDPFLAYAVQVEEDLINQVALNMYQAAAVSGGNPNLSSDINIVMQDTALALQDALYIRARDAFLLQKADAQSGRVLMDATGTWVRTQQYVLRPDANTVQLINVSLRGPSGTGADPGMHTMDFRATLTGPVGQSTNLQNLPWGDWLNTQGPNLPTSPDTRYINLPGGFYELAGMEVSFADPAGGYLKESRTFFANIVDIDLGSIQEINTETLDLRMGTVFDNPAGVPRNYTTDWTVAAADQYWVGDPENPLLGGWNFTGGSSTSPPLFAYMFRTAAGTSWQAMPLLAVVQTTVVGDAGGGQSPNDYSGETMKDIWDALRVNETGGPNILSNNLQIRIFGTDVWDVTLPENNWQSQDSQIITVITPMSRMVWKPPPIP